MWDLVGNPEDRFSHNEAQICSTVSSSVCVTVILSEHVHQVVLSEHVSLFIKLFYLSLFIKRSLR